MLLDFSPIFKYPFTAVKIGIYGGSFNPVHLGHLTVADAACRFAQLDRLFWVPTACSPFKDANEMASGILRLSWLKLALKERENYFVDDQEIVRGGVSYTIDTVRSYVRKFPDSKFFYLIGMDNLTLLPKWKSALELAHLVEFIVVSRPSQSCVRLPDPFRVRVLNHVHVPISSSEIRQNIRDGKLIQGSVSPCVFDAIISSGAYQ